MRLGCSVFWDSKTRIFILIIINHISWKKLFDNKNVKKLVLFCSNHIEYVPCHWILNIELKYVYECVCLCIYLITLLSYTDIILAMYYLWIFIDCIRMHKIMDSFWLHLKYLNNYPLSSEECHTSLYLAQSISLVYGILFRIEKFNMLRCIKFVLPCQPKCVFILGLYCNVLSQSSSVYGCAQSIFEL